IDKIQKYIAKGGNLLITCEPENRGIVNPLLQQLGVQLMEGTLLQQSSKLAPNNIAQQITPLAASFSKLLNQARADSNVITMPGATALSYSNTGPFMVRPLLLTDEKLSWLTRKKGNLEQVITADAGKESVPGEKAAVKKKMPVKTKMDQVKTKMDQDQTKMDQDQTKTDEEQKVAAGTERKAEILKRLKLAREKMNQEQITTTNVENKDSDSGKVVAVLKKNMPTKTKMDQEQKVPTGTEKKAEILKRMKLVKGKMNKEQIPATNVYNNPPVDVNAKIQNKMLMAKRNKASIGNVKFSPEDGDIKGPFPTALVLTRTINNKEQRIVVTGDADFMSTGGMSHPGGRVTAANFVFNTAIFSWLSYGEFPIDASRPGPKDISVTVDTGAVKVMRLLLIWILPGLLLLFASVLLIRRKRK
ncbi:MAG: transporter permease subunit, partial [Sediminibacterium sp.]|nr:transporter permease subunit [Sediminibacterium sp.]